MFFFAVGVVLVFCRNCSTETILLFCGSALIQLTDKSRDNILVIKIHTRYLHMPPFALCEQHMNRFNFRGIMPIFNFRGKIYIFYFFEKQYITRKYHNNHVAVSVKWTSAHSEIVQWNDIIFIQFLCVFRWIVFIWVKYVTRFNRTTETHIFIGMRLEWFERDWTPDGMTDS